MRKGPNDSCSQTKHPDNWRCSRSSSPGEALHDGVRSMALLPHFPEISEITDRHINTQTHTQGIVCTCLYTVSWY